MKLLPSILSIIIGASATATIAAQDDTNHLRRGLEIIEVEVDNKELTVDELLEEPYGQAIDRLAALAKEKSVGALAATPVATPVTCTPVSEGGWAENVNPETKELPCVYQPNSPNERTDAVLTNYLGKPDSGSDGEKADWFRRKCECVAKNPNCPPFSVSSCFFLQSCMKCCINALLGDDGLAASWLEGCGGN